MKTQDNDTQDNDTQHNVTEHDNSQQKTLNISIKLCHNQHNNEKYTTLSIAILSITTFDGECCMLNVIFAKCSYAESNLL